MTIDEKVAEKMGWIPTKISPSLYDSKYPMDGFLAPDGSIHGDVPNFSTDWNATKILIKFMRERGYSWVKEIDDTYEETRFTNAPFWEVDVEIFIWGHKIKHKTFEANITDDNLPLAACEAFLQIDLKAIKND